ncbi:MAG: glycerol-3-phosphate 1-O-acyltransferase PlsY [Armatimonadota bacterium]
MEVALLLLCAYLIGSIPFGMIVGLSRGVDIRKHGSGNIGATNVLRLLGPGPAALVFVGDTVKGVVPVMVGARLLDAWAVPRADLWLMALALAPILGHTFPIFLRFRGGRAVATTLGALLGMSWRAGVIGLGIWIVVVALTRYISLASIIAAPSVPVYLALAGGSSVWCIFWAAIAALIVLRHIPNIRRLRQGTEPKVGQRSGATDPGIASGEGEGT